MAHKNYYVLNPAPINNTHDKLNDCLQKLAIKTNTAPADNILDFDNVIVNNERQNAGKTYKMNETLAKCFQQLKNNNIRIEHFRIDSAAYQQLVVEETEKNCTCFYIRIDDFQNLKDAIKDIPESEWKQVIINNKKVEIADTPFIPFNGKKAYRAVVQRRKRKDEQFDIFTQSPYAYYAVMTNNETPAATNQYVTEFYNARGDSDPP